MSTESTEPQPQPTHPVTGPHGGADIPPAGFESAKTPTGVPTISGETLPPSDAPGDAVQPASQGWRTHLRWMDWRVVCVVLLALVAIPIWRAVDTGAKPAIVPEPAPAVTVAVAPVTRETLYNEVTIPAEFRPYLQVELHAKVSGYVQEMKVDIGDQVKAGQLLAQLEVPELKSELDRAMATQKRTEADYRDAHLVYTRLQAVNEAHPNLVAQQELDNAEAKDHTTEAALGAAKADVEKYQSLMNYTRIVAPFDGIVTHRYADPGSLIQAGTTSDTQSLPLVRVSDNYHLRLDFPVSVDYVKDIHLGQPVQVKVGSLKGKTLSGIISRCTFNVNDQTRTMITEVEVPNPNLELVPGMYAAVVLKVDPHTNTLAVPIEAVSADRKPRVFVINARDEVEEQPVTFGLETPTQEEVLSGLKEGDLVLVGSRSQVKPGEKVEPKIVQALAEQGASPNTNL